MRSKEIPLVHLLTVDVICATPAGRSTSQLWGLRAVLRTQAVCWVHLCAKDTNSVLRSDWGPFHFLEQPDPVNGPSSPFLSMSPVLKFLPQPNLWHCLCLEISRRLSKVLTPKTPLSQCCSSCLSDTVTQKSLANALTQALFEWCNARRAKKRNKQTNATIV